MFLLDLEVARRLYRNSAGQTISDLDKLQTGVAIAAASQWMTSNASVTFKDTKLFDAFAERNSNKEEKILSREDAINTIITKWQDISCSNDFVKVNPK